MVYDVAEGVAAGGRWPLLAGLLASSSYLMLRDVAGLTFRHGASEEGTRAQVGASFLQRTKGDPSYACHRICSSLKSCSGVAALWHTRFYLYLQRMPK